MVEERHQRTYFETMNNHIPTLETCQKLKAAGFPQETEFYWVTYNKVTQLETKDKRSELQADAPLSGWEYEDCAAPLLTEILEQLPHKILIGLQESPMRFNMHKVYKGKPVSYSIGYGNMRPFAVHRGHYNPSEAAALLWLELNREAE